MKQKSRGCRNGLKHYLKQPAIPHRYLLFAASAFYARILMMSTRILFVDDDKDLLELFTTEFTARGLEVFIARNGEEFHSQAFKNPPHVIVLDIMLGDENGVQVYDHLLRNGLDPKIPVVFLSSLATDRVPSPAAPGRSFSLRAKPIHMEDLFKEIMCLAGPAK